MPTIPIKWSDNTEELRRNLVAGMNTIEATRESVDKLVQSFQGDRLAASAQKWVLAINQVGGATKLTASEQERAAAVLDKYVEKQNALGKAVPQTVSALSDQLHAIVGAREATEQGTIAIEHQVDVLPGFIGKYVEARTVIGLMTESYTALTDLIAGSIEAYGKAEQAQVRLEGGLRAVGLATPAVTAAYRAYAEELEKTTTVSRAAAVEAEGTFTLIGNVGPAQMQRALKAAADFSAVTGKSFEDASLAIAKATEGNIGQLKRYGIQIDQAEVDARGIGVVFDAIEQKMNGQAELIAGTMLGSWQQLTNQWEHAKEELGASLTPAVAEAAHVLGGLVSVVAESPTAFLTLVGASTALAGSMVWMSALSAYGAQLSALAATIGGTLTANVVLFAEEASIAQGSVLGLSASEVALAETSAAAVPSILGLAEAEVAVGASAAAAEPGVLALTASLGPLAAIIATAAAAWMGGKWLGEKTGLTDWIASLGGGALAAQELANRQDLLAKASQIAGHAIVDAAEAARIVKRADDEARVATDNYAQASRRLKSALADAGSALSDLSGDQIEAVKYYLQQKVGVSEITTILGVYGHQVELVKQQLEDESKGHLKTAEALRKHEEELKKFNDNMAAVLETARGFGVIVGEIDGAVLEGIKYYVARGDALQKVGEMYGLTAVQIQALGEQFKFEQSVVDATAKSIDKYTQAHQVALPVVSGLSDDAYNLAAGLDDEARAAHSAEVAENRLNDLLKQQITTRNTLNDAIAKQNVGLPGGASGSQIDASGSSIFAGLDGDFAKAVANFGPTLSRALEGGGGLLGAAESLGTQLGEKLGAKMGSALSALGSFGGPIGSAIGALAGPLISLIASIGGPSKQELAGRDVVKSFEGQFKNTADMIGQVQAAYLATGHTAAEANAAIKAMWDAEKQGADATKAAIDKVNAVLERQKALAANAQSATSGIGGFLGVNTGAMDAKSNDNTKLADLNKQLAGATPGSSQAADLQKQIAAVTADLLVQAQIIDATAIKTQDDASAMGAAVVGAFDAAIQGGASFAEALKQNQPAIEALRAELDKAGLDGGAAFNLLTRQIDLMKDPIAGPVLTAVQNLASGFKGLAATGSETKAEFQGFGDSVKQAFDKLVAQGKSAPEIMVAMQGPLQELWQEEQQYGFKLDDATQALLDQAEAAGEVGEKHKSTSQQMLDAENKLVDIMSLLAHRFGVDLPNAVESGVRDAKGDLGDLKGTINDLPTSKTFTFDIQTNGDIPQLPSGDTSGGLATGGLVGLGRLIPFPVAAMASGGIVPQHADYERAAGFAGGRLVHFPDHIGTDTVPAMLTPRELVINEVQTGRLGEALQGAQGLNQAVGTLLQQMQLGATGTDGGGTTRPIVKVQLMVGRKVLTETLIDAYRVDESGIRKVNDKIATEAAKKVIQAMQASA